MLLRRVVDRFPEDGSRLERPSKALLELLLQGHLGRISLTHC